ncbi:hypothetical protein [Streptomyces sp. NPDC055058]
MPEQRAVNTEFGTLAVDASLLDTWNRYGWPKDQVLQRMVAEQSSTEPAPAYQDIGVIRERGYGVRITEAPVRSKIAPLALLRHSSWIELREPDLLNIADQVLYRITGWDPADSSLTVELVEDWRPRPDTGGGPRSAES